MKKKIIFIVGLILMSPSIAKAEILDPNLSQCVLETYSPFYSSSSDVVLTDEELATITDLECVSKKITNTVGIEKLVNLKTLNLSGNSITSVDLSNNSKLTSVYIQSNQLTSVTLGTNSNLTVLNLASNSLTKIDLSGLTNLKNLILSDNTLTALDVSKNINLESLNIANTNIEKLDISNNKVLKSLSSNKGSSSTIGGNSTIEYKLISSISSDLKVSNNIITNVAVNSTPASLKSKIVTKNSNYIHKVLNSNGEEVSNNTNISTGSKYRVSLNETIDFKTYERAYEEYTLIVKGDVTGTGDITISDVSRAYQCSKGKVTMEDEFVKAADLDNDGKIMVNDITKLYNYIKGRENSL